MLLFSVSDIGVYCDSVLSFGNRCVCVVLRNIVFWFVGSVVFVLWWISGVSDVGVMVRMM